VAFSVSETPGKIIPNPGLAKVYFPHASTEPGEEYFLTIANFSDHQTFVSVKVIGESGDNTLKIFNLNADGRILLSLRAFGVENDKVIVKCEAEEMFGAGLFRWEPTTNRLVFMYPFILVERP
jgi:hypothetical protein